MLKPILLSAFIALNLAPIHQVATSQGVTATIHLEAPQAARYTCSMHPEVEAAQPGSCPICKMDLVKQTHRLTLTLADAATKRAVAGATVRVTLEDGQGLRQERRLVARKGGAYEGAFHLAPGKQALTARVAGGGKAVTLTTRFVVK